MRREKIGKAVRTVIEMNVERRRGRSKKKRSDSIEETAGVCVDVSGGGLGPPNSWEVAREEKNNRYIITSQVNW